MTIRKIVDAAIRIDRETGRGEHDLRPDDEVVH